MVIDTTTGESRSFCTLTGATDRMFWYGSIAIDADDNVYIIVELVSSDGVATTSYLSLTQTGFQ